MPTSDGYSDGDEGEIKFCLNGNIQTMEMTGRNYGLEMDKNPAYHIGHMYFNGESSGFSGKIALLMISNNDDSDISISTLMNYYKLTKDYICDNQGDTQWRCVNSSSSNLYTIDSNIQNNYEIFPLQNDLKSLKGVSPINYDLRAYAKCDNDRSFNYNYLNKGFSYVADGQVLEYELTPKDSGTIMLRAFTDAKTDKQYFFEGFNDKQTLGLYRNANNKLCLYLDGKVVESSLTVSTGSWHTIGISYDTEDPNDSQVVFKYKNIRFFVDGLIDTHQIETWFNYKSLSFMIGRCYDENMIDDYANSYPLYGQIEMLAVSNYYVSEATLRSLSNELQGFSTINEYDEFGLLKYKELHSSTVKILRTYYDTKTTNAHKEAKVPIVKSEIKYYGSKNYTRNYETDNIGNVVKITDSVFGSHNYNYDYRGFLTKEDDIEYKYDNNGNITKAGNDTFTYDNLNRLKTINGWPVSFSLTNPGNPATYRDTAYRFEGRRLISISEELGIDEQKSIDYTYDSNGLIIKKVLGYWYDDDRDSEEFTTQYYYDGDKLITEINQYCRLDFLYDENGMLYGLIKDNSSKYFYVRDYLQNILGIVDQNGKLVVKYKYDAYGNSKGIEDTSGCNLGTRNPFRYKGYYYDDDTEMYYCKSRFYVPKWRRWLNSDSINYLEPQNITCLNLFAYCNNNPVMYVDENGNFVLSALLLTVALSALAGAINRLVGQFVSDVVSNAWKNGLNFSKWEFSTWETYVGSTLGGAIGGALATIPGAGIYLGSVFGNAASTAISMGLENATGRSSYSGVNFISNILVSGAIGLVSAGIVDCHMNISGINKGSHSFKQFFKSGLTKNRKYNYSMSMKTFGKGVIWKTVDGFSSSWMLSSMLQGYINSL